MNAPLLALAAIAFWATNAMTARLALGTLNVAQIQLLQFAGAALVFAVALAGRRRPQQARSVGASLVLGLIGLTGTMVFQYIAFATGPIGEVNIVAYAWPLLAALALLVRGRVPRPLVFLLLTALGFIGAALIVVRPGEEVMFASLSLGHLAAIASALCMATYTVVVGSVAIDQHLAHLGGGVAGFVIAMGWCMSVGVDWPTPTAPAFWIGLYLGIGPIGVGYLLWAMAMSRDTTRRVSMLGYLTPVASTGLLLVSGESIHMLALVGAVIVVGACAAIGFESRSHASA
ncbi:MAG: DMT family transporter [Hyphomicrobiaceae bacterium]